MYNIQKNVKLKQKMNFYFLKYKNRFVAKGIKSLYQVYYSCWSSLMPFFVLPFFLSDSFFCLTVWLFVLKNVISK